MRKKKDYSPNFSKKIRKKNLVKFVIIHYTGMQSEIESLKRLKSVKHKVSCHYLINRQGLVTQMVPDNKIAWHAGKSKWRNFHNLNEFSIGIELVNKGHNFGYEKFPTSQIYGLIQLCIYLKKKFKIKQQNFLGHSDIAPLRKEDPGENFPWEKLSKFKLGFWFEKKFKKYNLEEKNIKKAFFKNLYNIGYRYFKINKRLKTDKKIIAAFQRRYLPKNVTGKIDKKTLEISHFLSNLYQ